MQHLLERGIRMNGVTHLVLNKMDVLRAANAWGAIVDGKTHRFKTEKELKAFISKRLSKIGIPQSRIFFSESKERI